MNSEDLEAIIGKNTSNIVLGQYGELRKEVFHTELGGIAPGQPFFMFNYGHDRFIRVKSADSYLTIVPYRTSNPLPLNDDGCHVPIVDLQTGSLFWMSKLKPCLLCSECVRAEANAR